MTESAFVLTRSADRPSSWIPTLRAVRMARGLGLRETAERAGITAAYLSRVERGQRQLSVDALGRLAKVLGLEELVKLLAPYRETL